MRVEIKTNGVIKDPDIKALHLIQKAMQISTSGKMRRANAEFVLGQWGMKIL